MLDTGLRINLSHHPNVDANQQIRVRWRIQQGLGRIMIDLTIAAQREKAMDATTSHGHLHHTCFTGIDLVLTMGMYW